MSTKAIQGELWSIAPDYWSKHFEPWFLPIYRETLTQFNLTEQDMLLDAGCGSGLFSFIANKKGAKVTGIDAAPGLLTVANKRNPGIRFLEEDLEALPFADDSFDFVTAFNSLQYAGSFEHALKEVGRVLKPGGKLAIAIWDKPETSDAVHILKSIAALLPPPVPGTPGPFALSEDGKMEALCQAAGLQVLSKKVVSCPFIYRTKNEGLQSFMGTGPAALALKANSLEKVENSITTALEAFELADDLHFLVNQYLLFIVTK
jgi:SAM-dependent methyltransferase